MVYDLVSRVLSFKSKQTLNYNPFAKTIYQIDSSGSYPHKWGKNIILPLLISLFWFHLSYCVQFLLLTYPFFHVLQIHVL